MAQRETRILSQTALWMLVGISLTLLILLTLWQIVETYREARRAQAERHAAYAVGLADHTERALGEALLMLEQQVELLRLRPFSRHDGLQLHQQLAAQLRRAPQVAELLLADAEGRLLASSEDWPTPPRSLADRADFQRQRAGHLIAPLLSLPYRDAQRGAWCFSLSLPLTDAAGDFAGVVLVVLRVDYFSAFYQRLFPQPTERIHLLRQDGRVQLVMPFDPAALEVAFMPAQHPELFAPDRQPGRFECAVLDPAGRGRLVTSQTLETLPLVALMSVDKQAALGPLRQQVAERLLFLLITVAAILALTYQLARQSAGSQRELRKRVELRTARLKQLNRELAALVDIGQHAADDVQLLLDFALDKILYLTGSQYGYIYHYNEERREFTLNSWSKEVLPDCQVMQPQTIYQLEKTGIWGEAVRQRKPIMLNDFAAEHPLKKGYPAGHVPLRRFLTVPIFDGRGQIVAVVGLANREQPYRQRDVRQLRLMMDGVWKIYRQRELEQQLSRAVSQWQASFDAIIDAVLLYDDQGRLLRCNRATTRLFKRDFKELLGMRCRELLAGARTATAAEASCLVCACRRQKSSIEGLLQHDGRWLQIRVDPILDGADAFVGAVQVIHDDSQRIANEEKLQFTQAQLLQSEKLASIGQLAAGIAHEINNPLSFISSNLANLKNYISRYDQQVAGLEQLALAGDGVEAAEKIADQRRRLKFDYIQQDVQDLLAESTEGCERLRRIVEDLKTFARSDQAQLEEVDLHQCLDSTINIAWNQIKYVARLERDYGQLPRLWCNAQQINQVILNLLINAVQAIEAAGRGEAGLIRVQTRRQEGWAVIELRDNGCGMSEAVQKRIFEPFFTTKEVGKGTGLGLSISYDILQKHGGRLTVESRAGEGSCFGLWLPLSGPVSSPAAD
ncbi:GAF domain-containing protein [Desulfuromonas thiophila]|uniref:GAF domain-containing protein n=1 Tax=Desulfuromonas thiophila TaxID=57664 RepID=UPI0029F5B988|nr:GAF domain-containing protein [Desulfuromonas thiophila]